MADLDFETCERKCHEMWAKLAETGGEWKYEVLSYEDVNLLRPHFFCFSCYYVRHVGTGDGQDGCNRCPIKWGTEGQENSSNVPCARNGSPFFKWDTAHDAKTRKKYAAIIATLPWVKR